MTDKDPPAQDMPQHSPQAAPYPGLRYYLPSQSNFFAAREQDLPRCFETFVNSRILVLHGTTGCGKSSFLRAGLKPYLEERRGHRAFAEDDQGELQVVRSDDEPLRALAGKVHREIAECAAAYENDANAEMHGGTIDPDIVDLFQKHPSGQAFEDIVADNPDGLVETIMAFEQMVEEPPVLVIDQAEEVFTLNINDKNGGREFSADEVYSKTDKYFKFLALFAQTPMRTQLIISLRTEYKGQFDDRLGHHMSGDRSKIRGFHLPDLDEEGMVKAIVKPTEQGDTFAFAEGVPQRIVAQLVEEIPPGGRLPVLQVVCLRLWLRAQERRYARSSMDPDRVITITELDVSLLGGFDTQIREYLRDRLREMLEEYLPKYRSNAKESDKDDTLNVGQRADRWMMFFREELVDLQADGRATTKKLSGHDLRTAVERRFSQNFARWGSFDQTPEDVVEGAHQQSEFDWLARDKIGILRKQIADGEASWVLGHDSIGLVLERWYQMYGASIKSMMMMDMNMPRQADDKDRKYFPPGEELPETTILVPEDLLWDRYLLQFAQAKGFARRVGLNFETPDKLKALQDGEVIGVSWETLAARLEDTRRNDGKPVLFICERNNIPEDAAAAWIDVAIADEFAGNALIGPEIPNVQPLAALGTAEKEKRREDYIAQLKALISYLVETEPCEIICYDESAAESLMLAAQLAEISETQRAALERKINRKRSWELPYSARDFLFEAMWNGDGHTFIIGSDYGRAVAQQAGFQTYFSRQNLLWLSRAQDKSKPLNETLHRVVTHAVWNLGYPGQAARDPALEYRIASLAYCVAEYVRTSADEFVSFIYDRHDNLRRHHEGFQISQEVIREVVQDCFNWYHFENYGRYFYKDGSPQRYWVEEEPGLHASNSRGIYFEMYEMRARCMALFQKFEAQFAKCDHNSSAISIAKELSDCAWNNYEIFNFHDALTLIRRAVDALELERTEA